MAKKAAQTRKALAQPVEVLDPAVQANVTFITEIGQAVVQFLGSALSFFREARVRETKAVDFLTEIRSNATLPKTVDEDVAVQQGIKFANTEAKGNTEFWKVTSALSKLHKWTVAGRDRSVVPYEQASKILNDLHNRYVAQERERAAAEQRRLQAEENARAERERQAEVDELERLAVEAETGSAELSDREDRFVVDVVEGDTPYAAAKAAGYQNPEKTAERLMKTPKIVAAIEGRVRANKAREQAAAVAQAPLARRLVEVAPNVEKAVGTQSRTTWRAEVTDATAFIAAVVSGQYGIPLDVLQINQAALNVYARDARPSMERWPGVEAVPTTRVV